jgi:hypothetical protein
MHEPLRTQYDHTRDRPVRPSRLPCESFGPEVTTSTPWKVSHFEQAAREVGAGTVHGSRNAVHRGTSISIPLFRKRRVYVRARVDKVILPSVCNSIASGRHGCVRAVVRAGAQRIMRKNRDPVKT